MPALATVHLSIFRDFPAWAFCLTIVALFVLAAVGGQAVMRPLAQRWFGGREYNDLVGHYISAFGVLYGITLGLISVAAWENYGEVESTVSKEAAAVAALYRNIDCYPEPVRSNLTGLLREYTRQIIDVSWPEMRRGVVPQGGHPLVIRFQRALVTFVPRSPGQIELHRESIYRFNQVVELRRLRWTA
jgi:hypothetical protein